MEDFHAATTYCGQTSTVFPYSHELNNKNSPSQNTVQSYHRRPKTNELANITDQYFIIFNVNISKLLKIWALKWRSPL